MALESELKFPDVDFEALRDALQRVGADPLGAYFEENLVFDFPDRSLKARQTLLRLRRKGGAATGVLTVKTPVEQASAMKVYEESQTGVDDFDEARQALEALGYQVAFAYEKVREKWLAGDVLVCLDLLPFGEFAELEGGEAEVVDLAGRLDLDLENASKATYHELNRAHREAGGLPADENFVFSEPRRTALCKDFSRC